MRRTERTKVRGFTLIELLVVMAIIGLLATVVAFNMTEVIGQSNQKKVQADLTQFDQAIEMYRLNSKKYPQRLEDLVTANVVKKLQTDPWGHPYHYSPPSGSKRFAVSSYGADGVPGGEGEAQDLTPENIDQVVGGR